MSRQELKGLVVNIYRNHADALVGERIVATLENARQYPALRLIRCRN